MLKQLYSFPFYQYVPLLNLNNQHIRQHRYSIKLEHICEVLQCKSQIRNEITSLSLSGQTEKKRERVADQL